MKQIALIACAVAMTTACSQSQAPTAPTPPAVTPPTTSPPVSPPPPTVAITGTVTATNGGRPLPGVTVTISTPSGSATAIVDGTGRYNLSWPSDSGTVGTVTVSGSQIVTRQLSARLENRTLDLDAIERVPSFDQTFYEQLTRDKTLAPWTNYGLALQPSAPQIYLRTIDDRGRAIDVRTLNATAAAIENVTPLYTGRFGIAGMERGTDTREGQPGWITVRWSAEAVSGFCGRAQYGGTWIELYPANRSCACNGLSIAPRTVKHEMGHALGFYHTDSRSDVMNDQSFQGCDADPSPRERYHGAIAYRRQRGNVAPDSDLGTATITSSPRH